MNWVSAAKILIICILGIGLFGFAESRPGEFLEPLQKFNNSIELNMFYTGDIIGNCHGGKQKGSACLGLLDFMLNADLEKLFHLSGAKFYVDGIVTHGKNPGDYIGDFQGVSNIAAENTFKLYEFWLQQEFCEENCSVLAGIYDLNSEFDVNEFAGVFLNSSFGMGPDFSQSGVNGAPTYPNAALAMRFRLKFLDKFYLQSVMTDGVPGNQAVPAAFSVNISPNEGALFCTELGYLTGADRILSLKYGCKKQQRQFQQVGRSKPRYGRYGRRRTDRMLPDVELHCHQYCKLAVGGWYYTAEFDGFAKADGAESYPGSWGCYLLGEKVLWSASARAGQILGGFFRIGYANPKMNPVSHYCGCGLVFSGPSNNSCYRHLGLALAAARLSEDYRLLIQSDGEKSDNLELALELVYRSQINKWLTVQPDIQYILNPGYISENPDSIVLGLRLEIDI